MAENLTLQQQIAQLQAENNALKTKAAARQTLTLKVSEKGCMSIYGCGRWPISVYRSQAERLFTPEMCKRVSDFIEQNKALLKVKE